MTTTVCPRTLRSLVGAYLARPCVELWLVAGDLYEEAGDEANAALWRRRARWFPVLWAKWQEMLPIIDTDAEGDRRLVTFAVYRRRLQMIRYYGDRLAWVWMDYLGGGYKLLGQWITNSSEGDRYAVKKILDLIDAYGASWE